MKCRGEHIINRLGPGGESQLSSKVEPMRGFPGLA